MGRHSFLQPTVIVSDGRQVDKLIDTSGYTVHVYMVYGQVSRGQLCTGMPVIARHMGVGGVVRASVSVFVHVLASVA